MFRDGTVFIIGAGASAEFNLPIGPTLLQQIKTNCQFDIEYGSLKNGKSEIFEAVINRHGRSAQAEECMNAMKQIHRSIDHAGSIDELINRYNADKNIAEAGKLQIAYAIASAERNSSLFSRSTPDDPIAWEMCSQTWIKTFTQILFEGIRNEDVDTIGNEIAIICFNYDRAIEFYLSEAIVKSFAGVNREHARKIVDRMHIVHPYGTLGSLAAHPFGQLTEYSVEKTSQNILTWSESDRSSRKEGIHEAITAASTLVFLGFAFAPQNMDLLFTNEFFERTPDPIDVYATGYGYSAVIDARLRQKIANLYPTSGIISEEDIHIQYDMKCAEFMRAHSMALVE